MPIRILDAVTVGRIAAGEVVERPSSVVKELVENSLDAGATAITVEIRGGGIDYLRVTDNGCGIEPGQVRLAFENHATSKLQNADQLSDIRTLGFRGEALPSIAAVSRVEMTTRARNQDTGMKANIEGGAGLQIRETGCPEGTTLVMQDLFYNIPVRRAFLKKPAYEGGLVNDTVARLLIGNPGVSMRFINNGNTIYHSYGDSKLRHAIFAVYGKATAEKMLELDAAEGGTRVWGMIGIGELAKSTRAHQMFFINGRSVRCPLLSRVLEQVCRSRVTIGMYPMCAIHLSLPPNSIDVNVHPNKLEVRFRDEVMTQMVVEKLLQTAFEGEKVLQLRRDATLSPAVRHMTDVCQVPSEKLKNSVEQQALSMQTDSAKNISEETSRMPSLPGSEPSAQVDVSVEKINEKVSAQKETPRMPPLPNKNASDKKQASVAANGFLEAIEHEQAELVMPNDEKSRLREVAISILPKEEEKTSELFKKAQLISMEELVPIEKQKHNYRVIGVIFKTYILIEVEDTLLLIDQHAAHERLRYEMYLKQIETGTASQQLLTPIVLRLSAREMALILDNLELLTDTGYTIEPFGEYDIQVRAVPMILGRAEVKPLFMDMIHSLNQLRVATIDARRAEIMQMACKSAVKGGETLSDSEINALISEMLETGAPPTCPHGRPVVKAISRRELEKMFKRIQ